MLSIHSLFKRLAGKDREKGFVVFEMAETDSTNRRVREVAKANQETIAKANAPVVVLAADYQTAGRGAGTNSWTSERGSNLLFSVLMKPSFVPVQSQFMLSMMGALALKEALDAYVPEGISLKWPNDIYWKDQKISGTLIETTLAAGRIKDCVFGVGLNVNQHSFPETIPNPVSLCQIVGHDVDRKELLEKIMSAFVKYLKMISEGAYGEISAMYHEALYRRHGFYAYKDQDGVFDASVIEVEDDGHLVLRDKDGCVRSYAFKEIDFVI